MQEKQKIPLYQDIIIELAQFPKWHQTERKKNSPQEKIVLQSLKYLFHDNTGSQKYGKIYYKEEAQNLLYQKGSKRKSQIVSSFVVTYQSSKVWWIRSAFVKKQFRGKGIFTEMFRQLCRKAEDLNVKQIRLYVSGWNIRAEKLYRTLGFEDLSQITYFHEFFDNLKPQLIHDNEFTDSIEQPAFFVEDSENIEIIVKSSSQTLNKFHQKIYIDYSSKYFEKCIVCCRYYTQFDDWHCGLTLCISQLSIKKLSLDKSDQIFSKGTLLLHALQVVIQAIKKEQNQKNYSYELPVTMIRLIMSKILIGVDSQGKQIFLDHLKYINQIFSPMQFAQEPWSPFRFIIASDKSE